MNENERQARDNRREAEQQLDKLLKPAPAEPEFPTPQDWARDHIESNMEITRRVYSEPNPPAEPAKDVERLTAENARLREVAGQLAGVCHFALRDLDIVNSTLVPAMKVHPFTLTPRDLRAALAAWEKLNTGDEK